MFDIALKNKRQTTKSTNVAVKVTKLKWTYPRHVARTDPGRWDKAILI